MALKDSLSKQMGFLFLGKLIAYPLTFIAPLVVVRVFAQGEYGLYKLVFLLTGTLQALFGWGLPSSLYYFLPRDAETRSRYVWQTVGLVSICGGIGCIVLFALKGYLVAWFNSPTLEPLIPYLGVVTLLMVIGSILEIVMIAARQARLAALAIMTTEFVRAGLIIGAVVIGRSLMAIIIAMMFLGCLRIGTLVLYLKREGLLTCGAWNRDSLRAQVAYVLPFGMAAVVAMLVSAVPQYYIALQYEPAIFAVFMVGWFTPPLISFLFDAVSEVTLVKVAELQESGSLDRVPGVLSDAIRKICLTYVPLFFFLLIVGHDLVVLLYTSKFEAAVPIFRVFLLMIPLQALSLDHVPRAFAETGFLLRLYTSRLILTALLLPVLTSLFELPGAAGAVVAALVMTRWYANRKVAQLANTTIKSIVPWGVLTKIVWASVLASGTALVTMQGVSASRPISVSIAAIAFSASYLLMIWKRGVISGGEKAIVLRYIDLARAWLAGHRVPVKPDLS